MTDVVGPLGSTATNDVFADAAALTERRRRLRALQDEFEALMSESRTMQQRVNTLHFSTPRVMADSAREIRARDLDVAMETLTALREHLRETRTQLRLLRQHIHRDEQRLLWERTRRGKAGS